MIPTEKVTTPYGFSFSKHGWHPYVASLHQHQQSEDLDYDDSLLMKFHRRFAPGSLQEAVLPESTRIRWAGRKHIPHSWPLIRDLWLLDDDSAQRYVDEARILAPDERSPHVGPFTVERGRSTFERLLRVSNSIRVHGYDPTRFDETQTAGFDGYGADGYFLWDGNDYRFVLLHGHHRVAAAAFLGIETLHLAIRKRYVPFVELEALVDGDAVASWLEPEARQDVFVALFSEDGMTKARSLELS